MTNHPTGEPAQKKSGVSARIIMIPMVGIIFCLHVLIALNMVRINHCGQMISTETQELFTCSQSSNAFESGTDALADKAKLFVSTGDATYLAGYFSGLTSVQQWNETFIQSIRDSGTARAQEHIDTITAIFNTRRQLECRAMRLCAEADRIDLAEFPAVAEAPLTPEEFTLAPEAKRAAAEKMLSTTEYLQSQNEMHAAIGRAVQSASEEMAGHIANYSATLGRYRALQWFITIIIVFVLCGMCALLAIYLVIPLRQGAENVQRGEQLPSGKGLREFRRMADSYNELLVRWQMMESYLRRQSQTDTLTGLPNRLAFQNLVTQLSWESVHSSVTVFSLDVNGLKETNDVRGHAYGDTMLRECAACIQTTLGAGEGRQCFRFGGDEFAAFWVDVPESEIGRAIERFNEESDAHGVSISIGYAHAADLSDTTVEALLEQADKNMYDAKENYHRQRSGASHA